MQVCTGTRESSVLLMRLLVHGGSGCAADVIFIEAALGDMLTQ